MNNGIDSIIIKSNKKTMFNRYLNPADVGNKLLKGFLPKYIKGKGVALDEVVGIGTISNLMGLSTLIEIREFAPEIIVSHSDLFSEMLTLVFANLYPNEKLVFDAAPYLFNNTEAGIYIDSFIETISKALIVLIDMRDVVLETIKFKKEIAPKYAAVLNVTYKGEKISNSQTLLAVLEETIAGCLQRINQAALPTEPFEYSIGEHKIAREDVPSICEYRGWSFKDYDNKRPELYGTSLYFTYHATNAYLSVYSSLAYIMDDEISEEGFLDEYEEYKYNEDKRFYNRYKALFEDFKLKTISAGRYLEKTFNERDIDITSSFIGEGIACIEYDEVIEYRNGNAVINTLAALAIFINGALDEDYESIGANNIFYDKMQFSINNIKRIFAALKREKKEDYIASYKLQFDFKVPSEYESLIQNFRKSCSSIKVLDLVPLLANTYSSVFNFLIKYPTREMIDLLEMVMEQRGGDNTAWHWDKDGFNINNNLYYIFAVENFYDYYFEYENPLSEIGLKVNKNVEEARNLAERRREELKQAKAENKRLLAEFEQKQSHLDQAVTELINTMLDKKVNVYIDKYFADMIAQNINMCIAKERAEQSGQAISNAELYAKFPRAQTVRKLCYAPYIRKFVKTLGDLYVDNHTLKEEVGKKLLKYYEDQEKIIENKDENL